MRVAQITDCHVVAAGTLWHAEIDTGALLGAAVERLNQLAPDLVMISGDLTENGRAEEYAQARASLDRLHAPFLLVPGNHDSRAEMRTAFGDCVSWLGDSALQCVSDTGPIRVVGVDTLDPGQVGFGFDAQRRTEIAPWLATDKPTLLFGHHPPVPIGVPFMDAFGFQGEYEMAGLLADSGRVLAYGCGHVHGDYAVLSGAIWTIAAPAVSAQMPIDLKAGAPVRYITGAPWIRIFDWDAALGLSIKTIQ